MMQSPSNKAGTPPARHVHSPAGHDVPVTCIFFLFFSFSYIVLISSLLSLVAATEASHENK
jgi:hypothetical protein